MSLFPTQIWHILRNDLRLLWRTISNSQFRLAAGILLSIIVIAGHFIVVTAALSAKTAPSLGSEASIWYRFSTLMLYIAFSQAFNLLFEQPDFDLLLASPIPGYAILMARFVSIVSTVFLAVGIFLLPWIDGAIVAFSPRYFAGFLLWLLLAILATSGGIWLALTLVRWLGLSRARKSVQPAGFLLIFCVFYICQIGGKAVWSPVVSAFIFIARAGRGDAIPLAGFSVGAAALAVLTVWQLSRVFVAGMQETGEVSVARRPTYRDHRWVESLLCATFRKDVRIIARDPQLLTRIMPLAAFLLLIVTATVISTPVASNVFVPVLAPLGFMLTVQFSNILACMASSGEEGWDLILTSPFSRSQLLMAKIAASIALPLAITIAICVAIAYAGSVWVALLTIAMSFACSIACAHLQAAKIRPSPRNDLVKQHALWGRDFVSYILTILGGAGFICVTSNTFAAHIVASILLGVTFICAVTCVAISAMEVNWRPL
jgi:hypothetical protein